MDKLEEYRKKIEGTNIDPVSFLSTDYFNTFNSVIMLIDMLKDDHTLLEEIENWEFLTYLEHFQQSTLDFAPLAIELYDYAPKDTRDALEKTAYKLKEMIESVPDIMRQKLDAETDTNEFTYAASLLAEQIKSLIETGNSIIHKNTLAVQDEIDKLF
ncbi:MAG: hypothetical protein FWF23_05130 [Alphaproteobacteria bacterium]|nr:hypothetical protein [Alphaproteobacteria bacterium]MCL2505203.1 hypothetical protein [Alphaproteobacteria bacterium]